MHQFGQWPVVFYHFDGAFPVSAFAHAFGEDLGRMLAEQHSRIPSAELAGWLPTVPNWPRPDDLPHLPAVIGNPKLHARIDQALKRRAELMKDLPDPVLLHAGAAFSDRHQDFAYMVFATAEEPMLDGARSTYQSATGIEIDRDRVRLMNAVAAFGFLAFRHGQPPGVSWCGRTLPQDLAWTDDALQRVGI